MKWLIIIVIIAFFVQLLIAIKFFPSDNVRQNVLYERGEVSARKIISTYGDDEDSPILSNKKSVLRLEELDFKPTCDITNREAISAVHRAKTQICKQQIINKTCMIQNGYFYPSKLVNNCPNNDHHYGKYLGCYQDEKKLRLLSSFYGNYGNTNKPVVCLDICVQAGFPYAGVQYGSECFCGDNILPSSARREESFCNMKCPGDPSLTCGGYFTMNVFETGVAKFMPQIPITSDVKGSVRIIFLLTLNGRALRQVMRLINVLYRNTHYFYIHVDSRQDYLHRELSMLEKKFPNIKMASKRYSTIWGGASLLKMLLSAMKDFFILGWEWDFVINLSESDFPIKSLESLETFLSNNKGLNFVKSHGREVQRFIKKQGLDKTFIECESHMWRIGERKLPTGIVIDGGSDWIALSPDFVSYLVDNKDELLSGLETIFEHTLLPAESYFHTALRNTKFCNTYVDNNLHVTNWKRKLGCKCQYRHVVDWCGCSPNDFRVDDWPRIQSTQDRQLFFARKFEPIINQEIITRVEQSIGVNDHYLINNLEGYWQSIYKNADLTARTDDTILSHAGSIIRHNSKILMENDCRMIPGEIIEINSYNYDDVYKGNLILHKNMIGDKEVLIETWYKPQISLEYNKYSAYVDNVKTFKVSSDYDQKEQTFRNLANILGPLSEPVLLYLFSVPFDRGFENLTIVWLDPGGVIADVNQVHVQENNLTNFIKPNVKRPLLPGIWKVGLFKQSDLIVQTKFLITPLETFSGKDISDQESIIIHSGSYSSYKDYSHIMLPGFMYNKNESESLRNIAYANVGRLGSDLLEWIDSLSNKFYNVLGSCVKLEQNKLTQHSFSCGTHHLEFCYQTDWSSLSSDPKGHIGKLNEKTGLLERV